MTDENLRTIIERVFCDASGRRMETRVAHRIATEIEADGYVSKDVAKAMVAAKMENAAQIISANVSASVKADAIRALIREDARAALERVREKARREEREACAKIAESKVHSGTGQSAAVHIRARGDLAR